MTDLEPLEAALADLNGAHRTTGGIYPECVTCRQTWPCLSAEATETLTNALPALIAEVRALREVRDAARAVARPPLNEISVRAHSRLRAALDRLDR